MPNFRDVWNTAPRDVLGRSTLRDVRPYRHTTRWAAQSFPVSVEPAPDQSVMTEVHGTFVVDPALEELTPDLDDMVAREMAARLTRRMEQEAIRLIGGYSDPVQESPRPGQWRDYVPLPVATVTAGTGTFRPINPQSEKLSDRIAALRAALDRRRAELAEDGCAPETIAWETASMAEVLADLEKTAESHVTTFSMRPRPLVGPNGAA